MFQRSAANRHIIVQSPLLARRGPAAAVTLERCNVLRRWRDTEFRCQKRMVDCDRGLRASGGGADRYLRSRHQIARRVNIWHARIEVLVDHHAPFIVALAPQSLREVVGGEAADREKEALAVEEHTVLELECRKRAI